MPNCIFLSENGKYKTDAELNGPLVIIRRFGNKLDSAHYRGNTVQAGLNDLLPENKIFDILGFCGTLHLHLERKHFHLHNLAGSQSLVA